MTGISWGRQGLGTFAGVEIAREVPALLGEVFVQGSVGEEKRLAAGWRVRW